MIFVKNDSNGGRRMDKKLLLEMGESQERRVGFIIKMGIFFTKFPCNFL